MEVMSLNSSACYCNMVATSSVRTKHCSMVVPEEYLRLLKYACTQFSQMAAFSRHVLTRHVNAVVPKLRP
jgi:hypothetical protein